MPDLTDAEHAAQVVLGDRELAMTLRDTGSQMYADIGIVIDRLLDRAEQSKRDLFALSVEHDRQKDRAERAERERDLQAKVADCLEQQVDALMWDRDDAERERDEAQAKVRAVEALAERADRSAGLNFAVSTAALRTALAAQPKVQP